jgi:hypothetical protein
MSDLSITRARTDLVLAAPAFERGSISRVVLCLPTAPGLPLDRSAEFGTSAFLGGLSGKLQLADARSYKCIGRKAQ